MLDDGTVCLHDDRAGQATAMLAFGEISCASFAADARVVLLANGAGELFAVDVLPRVPSATMS